MPDEPPAAPLRRGPVAGIILFVGGLLLFGGLAIASRRYDDQTDQRLLTQQTKEAGALLTLSVDRYHAPLTAAARTAGATGGSTDVFTDLMTPMLGDGGLFHRAALFRVGDPYPAAVVGNGGLLLDAGGRDALTTPPVEPLQIVDMLAAGRVLGYGAFDASAPDWIVYAERELSPDPSVRRRTDEAFDALNYAIYLGDEERPDQLLGASTDDLPLTGRRAAIDIPFGDQQLRLVTTPRRELGSSELQELWWGVLAGGVVASAGVAWLLERVLRSRQRAEELAALTEALYEEQRVSAEQLQRSLLPELTDVPPGVEVAGRYWPAGTAHLIGGDFYDVFRIDARRWGVLIGDVCGKGMEAASLTGLARYTVQGAAPFCESPSDMLRATHVALRQRDVSTFCTACLLVVELMPGGGARAQICLGGHPGPLLRRADGSVVTLGTTGSLLGWFEPELHDVDVTFAPGDVLVLYTDGLTDAPGDQAVPIEEVEEMVAERGATQPIGQLADDIRSLKRRRRPYGSTDDTALLCLRFGAPPG